MARAPIVRASSIICVFVISVSPLELEFDHIAGLLAGAGREETSLGIPVVRARSAIAIGQRLIGAQMDRVRPLALVIGLDYDRRNAFIIHAVPEFRFHLLVSLHSQYSNCGVACQQKKWNNCGVDLVTAYRSGKSLAEIAEQAGISIDAVRYRLRAAGEPLRRVGRRSMGERTSISVQLYPATLAKLDRMAKGSSRSAVLERLIGLSPQLRSAQDEPRITRGDIAKVLDEWLQKATDGYDGIYYDNKDLSSVVIDGHVDLGKLAETVLDRLNGAAK